MPPLSHVAYKHVIWDWNGTLMDDAWLCVDIMNGILERRGRGPLELAAYREQFQFPVQRYYETLGFDPEQDPFSQVSHEFIDAYEQRRTECHVFEGAAALLGEWRDAGLDQVILSAYRHETLVEIVHHYGLTDYFSQLLGLDNIYAEGKLALAEQHAATVHHEPHDLLLIGDTLHDAEVARRIGADCLLVAHGHNSPARLKSTGFPVVNSLSEIADRVTVQA
ncbi:MAG: HAD family hydrolase [Puniceicoccales bacterium]